ncbi:hypothetical protein ABFS83_02G070700 [Erythranthe nasuta]
MANSKGPSSTTIRSMMYNGKNPSLPPKSPFPTISPSYAEFIPSSQNPPKTTFQNPRDTINHHQRTSSESFLIEEQPSWLDDLLEEPETPVRMRGGGGHRRSSSDSFTYADLANAGNYVSQDVNRYNKNMMWGPQDFDIYRESRESSFYAEPNPFGKIKNKTVAPPPPPRGIPAPRGNNVIQSARSLSALQDADRNHQPLLAERSQAPPERRDFSHVNYSETDKRAKQQFAQRSRVRKLQYISDLESSVQALQSESTEVSAELEFLSQQTMILSMENKALKQRLESLAQEQLIKYLEHEVLDRELSRLRNLYQQQQQPPPIIMPSNHRRSKSRDFLDQQFANLSLKQPKEAAAATNAAVRENSHVSGQLHM